MADRDVEAEIVSTFTTTQSVPGTLAIVPLLRLVIIYWYSNINIINNSSLLLTYRYGSFCSIFSSDLIFSQSFIQTPESVSMEPQELIVSKDVPARQTHKIYTDLDSGRREIRLISILPGN